MGFANETVSLAQMRCHPVTNPCRANMVEVGIEVVLNVTQFGDLLRNNVLSVSLRSHRAGNSMYSLIRK